MVGSEQECDVLMLNVCCVMIMQHDELVEVAQHATKGETPTASLQRCGPQEGDKHGDNCPQYGRSTEASLNRQ
jgi:hypothetical protein